MDVHNYSNPLQDKFHDTILHEEAEYLTKAAALSEFPNERSRVRVAKPMKEEPRERESYGGIP